MGSYSTLNSRRTLEGVHGVHVVPRAPFCLEEIPQHGDDTQKISHISASRVTLQLSPQRLWQLRPGRMGSIRCSLHVDKSLAETIANVITSLPFIALGIHVPRKNLNCKLYANSLIGIGVTSSLYHCSRGRIRQYMRWADYAMIATATVCLSSAVRNENRKLLMAASALCLPFQPLMVSAVHAGMMEVDFAKRALEDPQLRAAHNVHKASSLIGGALFVADDVFPKTPYIHAAWHLAAAVGVGTCNKLL